MALSRDLMAAAPRLAANVADIDILRALLAPFELADANRGNAGRIVHTLDADTVDLDTWSATVHGHVSDSVGASVPMSISRVQFSFSRSQKRR